MQGLGKRTRVASGFTLLLSIAAANCALPKSARKASSTEPGKSQGEHNSIGYSTIAPPNDSCAPGRTIEIRLAPDPRADPDGHRAVLNNLRCALEKPNTTVLLGPDVRLDFSEASDMPWVRLANCVTLASTEKLAEPQLTAPLLDECGGRLDAELPRANRYATTPALRLRPTHAHETPRTALPDARSAPVRSARTSRTLGPELKFGTKSARYGLYIVCDEHTDHIRISGFRLQGPNVGAHVADQSGIHTFNCRDVEISNMEIFGWDAAAIDVNGDLTEPPGSSVAPEDMGVRILNNYIHHNQHHQVSGSGADHALGYGVAVGGGAWAQIRYNLFDLNRHAITGSWDMGGYDARWNLVLKGGGEQTANSYTHQFDIHGEFRDKGWTGGRAGASACFFGNAFQFTKKHAIKVRGRPTQQVTIAGNIFADDDLRSSLLVKGAIDLHDWDYEDKVHIEGDNAAGFDSYGAYGVCDFDGDEVDDLFLATRKTWWFSSMGEFPWRYLATREEILRQVRFGYIDDDSKCDVILERGGQWLLSSGGTGAPYSIGSFGTPLAEVVFGRFDPGGRDARPGATKRTTHAFRRISTGEWQVSALLAPAWERVQRSEYPFSKLRFGDFTGDGVTDVLAVQDGHWAYSESARGRWTRLNPTLGDDVASLLIADLDGNGIDDLVKLEARVEQVNPHDGSPETVAYVHYEWFVSKDGRDLWRGIVSYAWPSPVPLAGRAFAGRFGVASGDGVLLTGPDRVGHFYAPGESTRGANPRWNSSFHY